MANLFSRLFRRAAKKPASKFPLGGTFNLPLFGGNIRRGSRETLIAYRNDAWLRNIVDLVSEQVAVPRWRCYKRLDDKGNTVKDFALASASHAQKALAVGALQKAGDMLELPGHEISRILARPCQEFTGKQVIKLMQVYLDLCGECFLLLTRDASGNVNGFVPIPPHTVTNTPADGAPNYTVTYERMQGTVPASEMIWLRLLDPEMPHRRGVGMGVALGDELDSLEAISRSVKAVFQRGGYPIAVVSVNSPDGDSEEAVDDLAKRYEAAYARPEQAGKVWFTPGSVAAASFAVDNRALQTPEIHAAIREFVRECYRVNPELIGDASSANRSSSEAALYHLWEMAIQPRVAFLEEALQAFLVPLVDDSVILLADDATPRSYDRTASLMQNATTAPCFLMNEARLLVGLPPLEELEGAFILPAPGTKPIEGMLPVDVAEGEHTATVMEAEPAADSEAVDPNTALNGAQVASMLEIVASVADGRIPRATGVQMLHAAFPLSIEQAEAILGEVGAGFKPRPELAPVDVETEEVPLPVPGVKALRNV